MTHSRRIMWVILFAALAIVTLRFWTAWCYFLLQDWNAVRLAPAFMLKYGPTPYPGLEGSPVTTWIYGPVPLWLNLPATLASSTAGALAIAGALNLLLAIIPLAVVAWGAGATAVPSSRLVAGAAFALCLAAWPANHLHYIQSDNVAVAFGLIANAMLLRSPHTSVPILAGAALFTALAVWSKQTVIGLVPAQVIWLVATQGYRHGIRYLLFAALAGLSLGTAFIGRFGFDGLWLNLIELPGRLPYWPEPWARARGLGLHLTAYVAVPGLFLLWGRRSIWRKDSVWLLPTLSWLWLIPLGCLAAFKVGGTANSLYAWLFLLPTAAFTALRIFQVSIQRRTRLTTGAVVAAFVVLQIHFTPRWPLSPNIEYLERADQIARASPGEVYFPWNPLVTFFSEGRFYHAEDGFYVRYLVGKAPSRPDAMKNLPPAWSITAFRGADTGWGIVEQLHPPGTQRTVQGEWTLYSWPHETPQR